MDSSKISFESKKLFARIFRLNFTFYWVNIHQLSRKHQAGIATLQGLSSKLLTFLQVFLPCDWKHPVLPTCHLDPNIQCNKFRIFTFFEFAIVISVFTIWAQLDQQFLVFLARSEFSIECPSSFSLVIASFLSNDLFQFPSFSNFFTTFMIFVRGSGLQ